MRILLFSSQLYGVLATLLFFSAGLSRVEAIIHAGEVGDTTCEQALQVRVEPWSSGVPFPYWRHLGQIDRSTGIYLGNGLVLTAAHVGPGEFRTGDGRVYSADPSTVSYFRNYDGTMADLCLFGIRYAPSDPVVSLPPIPLTTMPPQKGTSLLLIGGGAGAKSTGGRRFVWNDDYRVRWGVSAIEQIYSRPLPTSRYSSFGFGTRFDRERGHCQAAPGDSGGAAFHFHPGAKRWELAGVIVAVDSRFGAAEFGNQTYIADPALFRRELTAAKSGEQGLLASRP